VSVQILRKKSGAPLVRSPKVVLDGAKIVEVGLFTLQILKKPRVTFLVATKALSYCRITQHL
jgi:hypothetical protein